MCYCIKGCKTMPKTVGANTWYDQIMFLRKCNAYRGKSFFDDGFYLLFLCRYGNKGFLYIENVRNSCRHQIYKEVRKWQRLN